MPASPDLAAVCRAVLLTADPAAKARAARAAARDWRRGRIAHGFAQAMPAAPARPARPVLLPPGRMPRRGRGGTAASRIAMIHAVAHIEHGAIDLAFDMAGRFGALFPPAFAGDWPAVGAEEAMHFALLNRRLRQLGAAYGDLPAHDGLWETAAATGGDALARLAVVPLVLEARGLDATPAMAARFAAAGDEATARILADEVDHVAVGLRWFRHLCDERRIAPVAAWRDIVSARIAGAVRPPFNDSAREAAGLTRDYYIGIAPAVPGPDKGAAPAGRASSG